LVEPILRSWRQLLVVVPFGLPLLVSAGLAQALTPTVPGGSRSPAITPTSGLVTIESDLQKADNVTGIVTASGNVRIVYPDQRVVATARQAQYFSREGRVVLSGDVDVKQDSGHSIRAERLVYLVERERIVAEPAAGQQVITRYKLDTPFLKPESRPAATLRTEPKP
jgi:lipopolysaccharide export system protein LptA